MALIIGKKVKDIQFFILKSTIDCLEENKMKFYQHSDGNLPTGIVNIKLKELIEACFFNNIIHLDCALTVIILKEYVFKTKMIEYDSEKMVQFLWPLAYGDNDASKIAICTTLSENPQSSLRRGPGAISCAVQWIVWVNGKYCGMTRDGLRISYSKDAWGEQLVKLHKKLCISTESCKKVLLSKHYPKKNIHNSILNTHARLIHCSCEIFKKTGKEIKPVYFS